MDLNQPTTLQNTRIHCFSAEYIGLGLYLLFTSQVDPKKYVMRVCGCFVFVFFFLTCNENVYCLKKKEILSILQSPNTYEL